MTRLGVPFLGRRRETASEPPAGPEARADSSSSRGPPQGQRNLGRPSRLAGAAALLQRKGSSTGPLRIQAPEAEAEGSRPEQVAPVQRRRPWRKLLYIRQGFPDDYVDETFLMELQKNANVRMYDYSTVVQQTTVVTQHMSSIMVFIAVFIGLYRGTLTGSLLLWCSSVSTVAGVVSWDVMSLALRSPVQRIIRPGMVKGAVLFALLLFGLSPILRTLTEDTSSDTIWAMSVILFGANLAFHDYSSGNLTNIRFPGSVSLNAAVLASVLLASQLDSNLSVFAFLSFALIWFALFPIFRRYLKRISAASSIVTTVLLVLLAAGMFMYISRAIALLYILGTLFITFGCPLWLIWVQRYKNEIHGPWDMARPIVHRQYYN